VNLASNETEQSSTHLDHSAHLALDGDERTCSMTQLEEATWWSTKLVDPVVPHTVLLSTGVAFGCGSTLYFHFKVSNLSLILQGNLAALRPSSAISDGWGGFVWRANDGDISADYWKEGS
jgi:hypothetical protein